MDEIDVLFPRIFRTTLLLPLVALLAGLLEPMPGRYKITLPAKFAGRSRNASFVARASVYAAIGSFFVAASWVAYTASLSSLSPPPPPPTSDPIAWVMMLAQPAIMLAFFDPAVCAALFLSVVRVLAGVRRKDTKLLDATMLDLLTSLAKPVAGFISKDLCALFKTGSFFAVAKVCKTKTWQYLGPSLAAWPTGVKIIWTARDVFAAAKKPGQPDIKKIMLGVGSILKNCLTITVLIFTVHASGRQVLEHTESLSHDDTIKIVLLFASWAVNSAWDAAVDFKVFRRRSETKFSAPFMACALVLNALFRAAGALKFWDKFEDLSSSWGGVWLLEMAELVRRWGATLMRLEIQHMDKLKGAPAPIPLDSMGGSAAAEAQAPHGVRRRLRTSEM